MSGFAVRPLDAATWDDFAALVERHNGVWGGCWCMAFHEEGVGRGHTVEGNRRAKEQRVREGRAHAALVFDDATCVGWCQFGPTAELPRIKHRRAYEQGLDALPDWRITCFFVDSGYRRRGVASAALGVRWRRSRGWAAGRSRATRRTRTATGSRRGSCTTAPCRCSRPTASSATRQIGKHHWVVTRVLG